MRNVLPRLCYRHESADVSRDEIRNVAEICVGQDDVVTGLRQVRVGCEFEHASAIETASVFQVEPCARGPATVVKEEWGSTLQTAMRTYSDLYGNACLRLT